MDWRTGAIILLVALAVGADAAAFSVALNGDDANPGTADRPFASLQKARDAVRDLRANGGELTEPVVILPRGGEYNVTQTLELTRDDSGAKATPRFIFRMPGLCFSRSCIHHTPLCMMAVEISSCSGGGSALRTQS